MRRHHASCLSSCQLCLKADKVKLGVQKPSHFVPGTALAGVHDECVYTVVTVKTGHGELTATVCTPRALLNSPVAHELSDGEVALLVLLNADVPVHVQSGLSPGFPVRGLVGIHSDVKAMVPHQFGVLERVQLPADVHPLCANSRVRSCSPPITARHGHRWRLQLRWCEDIWLVHATVAE